ncbi:two-component system regulatory protein YycI [Halobacillus sp. A1]|uniref:two-component system regulatory protein YycI n=1 Tax=Halobacillus sp. A1 TaxID=2880262 RepID=UPI0020A6A550|nr:two-component system regulatory protein YycI [Halobacillus sp. A1]MCP3032160.1 two-component system regulatory protein YycI [Halobacillus sp. A1]
MQWGQIKTLFILSFLILDLFLLQQFLTKQEEAQVGTLQDSMFDESPAENNVEISGDVPEEAPEVSFLIASLSDFSESQLDGIRDLTDQEAQVFNENLLVSTLDEPVDIEDDEEEITEVVGEYVPFISQYSYWGWNEQRDKILFFQTTNTRTVYYNSGGVLMVDVEDGQMTGYQLTQLREDEDDSGDERELLEPIDVIDILYEDQVITTGDEVTEMKIGYYSAATFDPTQVFAPIWKITVNGEEDLFVNAVTGEGRMLDIDEDEFIEATTEYFMDVMDENGEDIITNEEADEEENDDESSSDEEEEE